MTKENTTDSPGAYERAGVDIGAANATKDSIKDMVRSTFGAGAIGDMGGFGGLFAPDWKAYQEPVLVSSVDGVGTKLKVAFQSGTHDSIGEDIVNHCANDILVQGAKPLFFMDYLALGKHDGGIVRDVVGGIARACRKIECALIGGETAEMAEFYQPGEYDLAGTIVGIVDRPKLIDGSDCRAGDLIIGLASNGLHTNGYTLAREVVFEQAAKSLDDIFEPEGHSFATELLRPHRAYVNSVLALKDQMAIKAMVHITGGGFWDNIPRVLPTGMQAKIELGTWEIPPIFPFIAQNGQVDRDEMYRVFNMGIGLMVVVGKDRADEALEVLRGAGEEAQIIGSLTQGQKPVEMVG
jgi:phosphoribosylformylglycinamidine cyclo-ligase